MKVFKVGDFAIEAVQTEQIISLGGGGGGEVAVANRNNRRPGSQ